MFTATKTTVVYVTSSQFKAQENQIVAQDCVLKDGTPVGDLFEFDIRPVHVKEVLEIDLKAMVMAEVTKAYSQIKVPCIVEHAGLIFSDYELYPGGLTKPMWDFLQDKFIEETHSAGRRATARAVVAYCDGRSVHTFVGETLGKIADKPRGNRRFYWDTIFIPDDSTGKAKDKTYAEIYEDPGLGLKYKMTKLSQSSRAMLAFLEFRRLNQPDLWPRV
jgi:inosine/xanthosine triphosphate pyrophosphatase family protein